MAANWDAVELQNAFQFVIMYNSGEEYANIWNNRALGDKFLKFSTVLGITTIKNPG